ncbi:hypothetical protein BJ166DRAFT_538381 [Pestalotiopsis sp. NC0098]|nr:hypothetical protein BJ166DRAFT_538381 [Pestalotiopsis sp. NC0098]
MKRTCSQSLWSGHTSRFPTWILMGWLRGVAEDTRLGRQLVSIEHNLRYFSSTCDRTRCSIIQGESIARTH